MPNQTKLSNHAVSSIALYWACAATVTVAAGIAAWWRFARTPVALPMTSMVRMEPSMTQSEHVTMLLTRRLSVPGWQLVDVQLPDPWIDGGGSVPQWSFETQSVSDLIWETRSSVASVYDNDDDDTDDDFSYAVPSTVDDSRRSSLLDASDYAENDDDDASVATVRGFYADAAYISKLEDDLTEGEQNRHEERYRFAEASDSVRPSPNPSHPPVRDGEVQGTERPVSRSTSADIPEESLARKIAVVGTGKADSLSLVNLIIDGSKHDAKLLELNDNVHPISFAYDWRQNEHSFLDSRFFDSIHGYIFVFDARYRYSFEQLPQLREKVLSRLAGLQVPMLIVGLHEHTAVPMDGSPAYRQEALELASEWKGEYTEVYFKDSRSAEKALELMVRAVGDLPSVSEFWRSGWQSRAKRTRTRSTTKTRSPRRAKTFSLSGGSSLGQFSFKGRAESAGAHR